MFLVRTLFKTEPSALLFVVIKECCDFDRGKLRVRGEYVWGKLEIGCGSSVALLYIPKKAETFRVRKKIRRIIDLGNYRNCSLSLH